MSLMSLTSVQAAALVLADSWFCLIFCVAIRGLDRHFVDGITNACSHYSVMLLVTQSPPKGIAIKRHRHAIMNRPHNIVRRRRQDCVRVDLGTLRCRPALPDPSQREQHIAFGPDPVRLLGSALVLLPLV